MAIEGRGEVGDRSAFMMMNSAGSERLHVFANLSHPVCDTVLCDDRWYSGMQRAQSCETEAFGVRKVLCCGGFRQNYTFAFPLARRFGENRLEISVL